MNKDEFEEKKYKYLVINYTGNAISYHYYTLLEEARTDFEVSKQDSECKEIKIVELKIPPTYNILHSNMVNPYESIKTVVEEYKKEG